MWWFLNLQTVWYGGIFSCWQSHTGTYRYNIDIQQVKNCPNVWLIEEIDLKKRQLDYLIAFIQAQSLVIWIRIDVMVCKIKYPIIGKVFLPSILLTNIPTCITIRLSSEVINKIMWLCLYRFQSVPIWKWFPFVLPCFIVSDVPARLKSREPGQAGPWKLGPSQAYNLAWGAYGLGSITLKP